MKPVTPARKRAPTADALFCLLLLASPLSCRKSENPEPDNGISIRIAHLHDYAWQDRNRDGQPAEMKPEAERQALYRELQSTHGLLVLRGLGSRASLHHLQSSLQENGGNYPHLFYIPGPDPYHGLGFLSPTPFSEVRKLDTETFRIREKTFQPLGGGVKISTPSLPKVWIWNQQAPSPEDSYERRRNEARILARELKKRMENGDQVLLSLHSREEFDSPMFRMLEETGLQRWIPVDTRGDSWTHRDPEGILFRQDQWIFVSPGLEPLISGSQVFDSEDLRNAGPYRHQGLLLQ